MSPRERDQFRLLASGFLGLGGLILMGMGAYFVFLRPALLPEDARYIGISLAQLRSISPGILPWLARVFDVLGGFMFATGLLTSYIAATSFRTGRRLSVTVVALAGLASIGGMAVTNFLIDSDYKWLLLAFTLPWLAALLSLHVLRDRPSP